VGHARKNAQTGKHESPQSRQSMQNTKKLLFRTCGKDAVATDKAQLERLLRIKIGNYSAKKKTAPGLRQMLFNYDVGSSIAHRCCLV
jgi:hypothetical protein